VQPPSKVSRIDAQGVINTAIDEPLMPINAAIDGKSVNRFHQWIINGGDRYQCGINAASMRVLIVWMVVL
jgi:hypothetical protein